MDSRSKQTVSQLTPQGIHVAAAILRFAIHVLPWLILIALIHHWAATTTFGDITTDLEAHWAFEDDAATKTVTDAIGSHTGTWQGYQNTEDITGPGAVDAAFTFLGAGATSTVYIADHSDLEFSAGASFSLSIWFSADSAAVAGATRGLITKGLTPSTASSAYAIFLDSGSGINFYTRGGSGSSHLAGSTPAYLDGTWQHCVATYNGSTGAKTVYLNTNLHLSGSDSTGHAYGDNTQIATIGSYYTAGGSGHFPGHLDDPRIYSRVLTPGDVEELFLLFNAGGTPDPVTNGWTDAAIAVNTNTLTIIATNTITLIETLVLDGSNTTAMLLAEQIRLLNELSAKIGTDAMTQDSWFQGIQSSLTDLTGIDVTVSSTLTNMNANIVQIHLLTDSINDTILLTEPNIASNAFAIMESFREDQNDNRLGGDEIGGIYSGIGIVNPMDDEGTEVGLGIRNQIDFNGDRIPLVTSNIAPITATIEGLETAALHLALSNLTLNVTNGATDQQSIHVSNDFFYVDDWTNGLFNATVHQDTNDPPWLVGQRTGEVWQVDFSNRIFEVRFADTTNILSEVDITITNIPTPWETDTTDLAHSVTSTAATKDLATSNLFDKAVDNFLDRFTFNFPTFTSRTNLELNLNSTALMAELDGWAGEDVTPVEANVIGISLNTSSDIFAAIRLLLLGMMLMVWVIFVVPRIIAQGPV